MKRFIEGEDRGQGTLLPELLDDYVAEDNPLRVVDVFVDELDLGLLSFTRVQPAKTGRPAYHPAVLLKLYIYGYLNRIQSSRRLEREAQRNVELMWLTQRLAPDFKTIANFRKGKWQSDPQCVPAVCRAVPATGPVLGRACGDRRQQIQGSQQQRPQLYPSKAQAPDGRNRCQSAAIWRNWTRLTGRSRR